MLWPYTVSTYYKRVDSIYFNDCIRPSLFFSFSVECVSLDSKPQKWRGLELEGPVPLHNICGAWKQQDMVTKSIWQQWRKERLTLWFNSKMNSEKTMNHQNCILMCQHCQHKTLSVFQIKVTNFWHYVSLPSSQPFSFRKCEHLGQSNGSKPKKKGMACMKWKLGLIQL